LDEDDQLLMQSGGEGGGGAIGGIGFENNGLLTLFNETGADSKAVFFYLNVGILLYFFIYILVD